MATLSRRPEITIVSARPMSQVGFRQEAASSDSGLPPPACAQAPESPKPASSDMPSVPPPRPKSMTGSTTSSGPPARPKLPCRPGRPNPSKPQDALPPDPTNLIDLSQEDSGVNTPVPKPRPRPAARSTVPTPEDGSSEPTLPSPIKPMRPTIIRPMPGRSGEEPAQETQKEEQAPDVSSEERSGPKLPSYIHTTASNDASVNELKAAFEKRKSGMSQPAPAPAMAPKPKPKPKPEVAQKPNAQAKPESDNLLTPVNSSESAEEKLMASINSELFGGDASPTPPSRRKRPTIIRAGVVAQNTGDGAEKSEKPEEGEASKPVAPVKSPVGRPQTSPKLQQRQLFQEDKKPSEDTEKSAPARPKPAVRKSTPTGPPKSISAQDLDSAQLTTPQLDPASKSLTPPPRKHKTGPPRPSQGPLSGSFSQSSLSQSSLSQSSLSNKADSNPSLACEKEPSKPSRPRGAPPSRPQTAPAKAPPTKSTPAPIVSSSGSTRQVIIHEVYPQSEAPKLPPRPGPGHPLFHYMMDCPYGIAVATHDYQSLQTDELSFNEGDVIVLLRQVDDSWFYGKNGEIEGIFPGNFVKVMEPLSAQGVQLHDQASAGAPADMLVDFGDGIDQDTASGPRCQARFDYDGETSEDLTFLEGEIIKLLEHVGEDWLRGELNGKIGIFPATFVEVIEDLPATPGDISGDNDWSARSQSDNSLVREAMYTFNGEEGELSFKAGDKIQLISYVSADWLFGEANGKQGKFPSAFIDDMPLHLPQYVGPKVKKTVKETAAGTQEASEHVRKEKREEKKTEEQKKKQKEKYEEKREEKQQPPAEEPRVQTPQSDTSLDDEAYSIAIHEFKGETADDLSFREADKVILLEWVNDEWLKGKSEMTGKVGIFPAAYVQIIKDLKKKGSRVEPKSEEETRTKVKALYEFTGENSQELSFKEGTVFLMHGPMGGTDDWRTGEIDGQVGLFPVSFVEEHMD
ncbi:SH3 domain-containing protein 19-like isoform X2 [Liolophura sinensis]|uniref:SH3 domain-containing protein 19-like isoform X2 n=1 Tax=Liolophura sinensis TaxID=3198878 RepID=UPI003158D020